MPLLVTRKKTGYGLTVKEAAVMVWGGLRGAVSLSLALLVDGNHLIGERAKELIFMQVHACCCCIAEVKRRACPD